MNNHRVDGVRILRLPLSETTQLIRGPVGTTVQLELNEGVEGDLFTVEIIREKLQL